MQGRAPPGKAPTAVRHDGKDAVDLNHREPHQVSHGGTYPATHARSLRKVTGTRTTGHEEV
jgi:hypothetical protein